MQGRAILKGLGRVALSVALLFGAISTALAQAAVSVDFLPDGRCTVTSAGEGFRSKVTYTPPSGGRRGERRCAFPPVQRGVVVTLSVSLPPGAPEPGDTRPALAWTQTGGRWTGTTTLSAWPDVIVVHPLDRPLLFWMPVGLTLLLMVVAALRWRQTRQSRRRLIQRPAAASVGVG